MAALAAVEAERRGARRHPDSELLDAGRRLFDGVQLRVFRMRRRAVIAFEIVLDRQLPVCRDLVGFAMGDAGGGLSQVNVQNMEGVQETSSTGKRILTLLYDQLK